MRLVYAGSGDIGLPTLRALLHDPRHEVAGVITQPDRPAGRRQEVRPSAIKTLALEAGIPVQQPERIRRPDAIAALEAMEPEVLVVFAYGQILPAAVLNVPRLAPLNLHASLLPRHRGAAPIQAAIAAGDRAGGMTVMYMDEGLDTGDILLTREFPLRRRETGGSLHDRLAEAAPAALLEALDLLAAGAAPRRPQDNAEATYSPKLTRDSGRIDWQRPCLELDRHIRAMNPWPGAFTQLPDGRALKIFSALPMRRCTGAPGEIRRHSPRGLLVACGHGGLLLREFQQEGKRRLPAADFLRGNPLAIGSRLGSFA